MNNKKYYNSLLLSSDNTIMTSKPRTPQYNNSATLAIGIGGTGIAALRNLKEKVFQQLIPDYPEELVPEYKRIRFLAIDSDHTVEKGSGESKLSETEFFSIWDQRWREIFTSTGKRSICEDPYLNWMDIDSMTEFSNLDYPCNRQFGRYLLFKKVDQLKVTIKKECLKALSYSEDQNLKIYIFSGISGVTGSGCFIDICYIVKKVLEEMNLLGASVSGLFFLPDVVISKAAGGLNEAQENVINSNGYAALKELDYLMSLENADDYFEQSYSTFFKIKTQNAPVDFCYLISATEANGNLLPNGFNYCINVSTDYVMSFLVNDQPNESDIYDISLSSLLASTTHGTESLAQKHGANRYYSIIGACNAVIPSAHILSLISTEFFKNLNTSIGPEKAASLISKHVVDECMQILQLDAASVHNRVSDGEKSLILPDCSPDVLALYGVPAPGKVVDIWCTPGNDYLDFNHYKRKQNSNSLIRNLESYDKELVQSENSQSLLHNVFLHLCSYCVDPKYGPYFAANLLHNNDYDLRDAVTDARKTIDSRITTINLQLYGDNGNGIEAAVTQIAADFCQNPKKKTYDAYKSIVERYFLICNDFNHLEDTADVLRNIESGLESLWTNFFEPLLSLLDTLKATFEANAEYLSNPSNLKGNGCDWNIISIDDPYVKNSLCDSISTLKTDALITDFVEYIINNYSKWIDHDDETIGQLINTYLSGAFSDTSAKTLEDYLRLNFPQANRQVALEDTIKKQIIMPVFDFAQPMFCCDPHFRIDSNKDVLMYSTLSVPCAAPAVYNAASDFANEINESVFIRKSSIVDRISALKLITGIPIYAYYGVRLLKSAYDKNANNSLGIGSHLYEYTGRGEDSDRTGRMNWRTFLPAPMPYSLYSDLTKHAEEKIMLYEVGFEKGIIGEEGGKYYIYVTDSLNLPQLAIDDFIVTKMHEASDFNESKYYDIRTNLESTLNNMRNRTASIKKIALGYDGYYFSDQNVIDTVRRDYFLQYPVLQQYVKVEIEKQQAVEDAIENLEKIFNAYKTIENDVKQFAYLLFLKKIDCIGKTGTEEYVHISRIVCTYIDKGLQEEQVLYDYSMEFADFPLYQAFLSFRRLSPDTLPRMKLDDAVIEKLNSSQYDNEDCRVAALIEKSLSPDTLNDLERRVANMTERTKIMDFYYSLVREIEIFRGNFPYFVWAAAAVQNSTKPLPPTSPIYVWDYETNQQLLVDVTLTPYYGRPVNGSAQWIRLNPTMLVWKDKWEAIQLDNTGAIINI